MTPPARAQVGSAQVSRQLCAPRTRESQEDDALGDSPDLVLSRNPGPKTAFFSKVPAVELGWVRQIGIPCLNHHRNRQFRIRFRTIGPVSFYRSNLSIAAVMVANSYPDVDLL